MTSTPNDLLTCLDPECRSALESAGEKFGRHPGVSPLHLISTLLDRGDSTLAKLLQSLAVMPALVGMGIRNRLKSPLYDQTFVTPNGDETGPRIEDKVFHMIDDAARICTAHDIASIGAPQLFLAWSDGMERYGQGVLLPRIDPVQLRALACGAEVQAGDPILRALDKEIDRHDPRRPEGSALGLTHAMLVFAAYDARSKYDITTDRTVFGVTLPDGQQGIGERFERVRAMLLAWLLDQSPEDRLAFRDRALSVPWGSPARSRDVLCELLQLPLPVPEVPFHEGVVVPGPDTQRAWVRHLERALERLDAITDPDGRLTDPTMVENRRQRLDDGDEALYVVRGTPWTHDRLDALEADLQARGLYLPADYRLFLRRCGGLTTDRELRQAKGEHIGEDLVDTPQFPEFPDDVPPRLLFLETGDIGYQAFEFGQTLQLIDQSDDWGGVPNDESRRILPYACFGEWFAAYVDACFQLSEMV